MATDATETKHDMHLEVTESKGPGKLEKKMSAFSDILKRQCIKADHIMRMKWPQFNVVVFSTVSLRTAWCGGGGFGVLCPHFCLL